MKKSICCNITIALFLVPVPVRAMEKFAAGTLLLYSCYFLYCQFNTPPVAITPYPPQKNSAAEEYQRALHEQENLITKLLENPKMPSPSIEEVIGQQNKIAALLKKTKQHKAEEKKFNES